MPSGGSPAKKQKKQRTSSALYLDDAVSPPDVFYPDLWIQLAELLLEGNVSQQAGGKK